MVSYQVKSTSVVWLPYFKCRQTSGRIIDVAFVLLVCVVKVTFQSAWTLDLARILPTAAPDSLIWHHSYVQKNPDINREVMLMSWWPNLTWFEVVMWVSRSLVFWIHEGLTQVRFSCMLVFLFLLNHYSNIVTISSPVSFSRSCASSNMQTNSFEICCNLTNAVLII